MAETNSNSKLIQKIRDRLFGIKIEPTPKPEVQIGVDTKNTFMNNVASAGLSGNLNLGEIDTFSREAKSRDQMYDIMDSMGNDTILAAALETYTEDATEMNAEGKIVWVEAADASIYSMITYLINSLQIDKHIYEWVYSLCKYGDLYIRLYHKSDVEDSIFKDVNTEEDKTLNEDVNMVSYAKSDNLVHYVEAVANPAEIFDLRKFGKTQGYIEAQVASLSNQYDSNNTFYVSPFRYKFKRNDINIYGATEFVHACLEDPSHRYRESVEIFTQPEEQYDYRENDAYNHDAKYNTSVSYNVHSGKSILYDVYKTWRQLMLLENSVLLNRLSQSAILRIIGVEVGDMPKEQVPLHLQNIKSLFEQTTSLNESISMSEYNNPGPMINNVYIPTHGGQGAISTQSVGGDVDVKSLVDLDYFKNRLYTGLKIPKQFLGDTDDSTGFNGGTALTITSSRYAKTIKRIQNAMIQCITDMINIMLIDKGLESYINKFSIKMTSPATQEEIDRQSALQTKIGITSDIMNLFGDIDDQVTRLKMAKALASDYISNTEVLNAIEEQIEKLEANAEMGGEEGEFGEDTIGLDSDFGDLGGGGMDLGGGMEPSFDSSNSIGLDNASEPSLDLATEEPASSEPASLPAMGDLGIDFTAAQ